MNPRLTFSSIAAALLAIAATGLVIKTNPAIAQQAHDNQTSEVIEEVIKLEAPILRRTVVGRTNIGAKIEDIELSRRVSYADLDLSKQAHVTKLKTRIKTTAKESCQELSDMSRFDPSDKREIQRCTNYGVDGTEEQVQAAIAAAG